MLANLLCIGTTGMKMTTGRRINGRGDLADLDGRLFAELRVWHWDRVEQNFGIGMTRRPIELCGCCLFYDSTQIHNGYPITDMFNNRKVVGDKQIA